MPNTNQIIQAVQKGEPVTEQQLKCAIIILNNWRSGLFFDLARAISESDDGNVLTHKTQRGLKRAWDSLHTNFDKDAEDFVMGSSFEPGISEEEKNKRRNDSTFNTLQALQKILTTDSNKS